MADQIPSAPANSASQPPPTAQPLSLSRTEITHRCNAVRHYLRPYLVPSQVVEPYLENHHGDIDAATNHILRDIHQRQRELDAVHSQDDDVVEDITSGPEADSDSEVGTAVDRRPRLRSTTPYEPVEAAAAASPPDSDAGLFQVLKDSNVPVNTSAEQCRRELILCFSEHALSRLGAMLSISEATLLLLIDDWDVGKAVQAFRGHEPARKRLCAPFDAMRSDTQDQNEQSARISALVRVTDRPDWYSMRLYLQKHKWDLIKAIVEWYRHGIRPFVEKDMTTAMKKAPGFGLRVNHNRGRLLKPSLEDTVPSNDADAEDWGHEIDDYSNASDVPEIVPVIPGAVWQQNLRAAKAVAR